MKQFIKNTLRASAFIVALGMVSCDALDLAPIDYYGDGNFWKRKEHVVSYMDGLHKNLRDKIFRHQYELGEARGGTSKMGTAVDGTSLNYQSMVSQRLTSEDPGITGFGDYYGVIANVNIFLQKTKEADYMEESEKSYYLAQAYGLRAFYYFDLYRTYGTAPLRLDPNEVVNGNFNPEDLYMERASGSKLMTQIKADLAESMRLFGDNNSFDPESRGNKKSYWSKAATEYLAAEVYLWNAKVSVDDNAANEADLAIAKQHCQSLMDNYGLSLMDNYADIFDVEHKGNSEIIMAIRYMEGEASNSNGTYMYNYQTGAWKTIGYNDENGNAMGDTLQVRTSGMQRIEYLPEFFFAYEKGRDSRRDVNFLSAYSKTDNSFLGTVFKKIMGHLNANTNSYIWDADAVLYRLAGVYFMMAEIANMEGGDVAQYINPIRKRAYGANWNEATDAYVNGDFTQNELAILAEKDKEMLGEGQRWYDLNRMMLTKGGDHLVFCKEGSKDGQAPILNKSTEAYKVFWPIETEMLNKDPKLVQTPGYENAAVN